VTVGSLTIPMMIRVGYPRHFAAAVEATASTGGQITPPVMGAAAFLMIEFLGVPYQTIIIAAIAPAFMHFFGVFMQVHFEAKRSGFRGLTAEELPNLRDSFSRRWPTLIPLVLLVSILMSGFTPYLAAFVGISSCLIVGLTTRENRVTPRALAALVVLHGLLYVMVSRLLGDMESIALFLATVIATPFALRGLGIEGRIPLRTVVETFETGAKYALAVGAAAATVGIVIGVVTLTGVGFKVSYIVTGAAQTIAGGVTAFLPTGWANPQTVMLLAALVMTGLVCILMGCGIPTTANYLIMVTVAAPTLVQLGVEPIVAHFFVFYYGVLADITPPVCIAAYAAAGMANSDPFRTGNTAFRLGLGKALVPFVFVLSPALLIVTKGFTWYEFTVTFLGCALGIVALSAALSNFFLVRMQLWERWLAVFAAILLIAPGLQPTLIGLALTSPIVIRHLIAWRKTAPRMPVVPPTTP
jgi:TRAP transporter 4TM/12TM fusion protein